MNPLPNKLVFYDVVKWASGFYVVRENLASLGCVLLAVFISSFEQEGYMKSGARRLKMCNNRGWPGESR